MIARASMEVVEGADGQLTVTVRYVPQYDHEHPSHLVMAQLQTILPQLMGAPTSDALDIDAETMGRLRSDFPAGDWSIEQAREYMATAAPKLALTNG